ncbi:hypothetical protein EDD11_008076 [Mortierella claussenii]|nr:hypothetical protein EDD11_008076 [Mortierella claussenii]
MATTDLRIIIAGSGIAGLSTAIALELAGLDYTILEQSPVPAANHTLLDNQPVSSPVHTGGAIQVGPTALHFLHQLGIYEEIQKVSKPVSGLSMNEHDMNYVGRIDLSTYRERYGYHTEVMTRSQLHALLLQRIPPKRVVSGKILGMIQDQDMVTVRCSDGTIHEGDVLIAADGGFSNVRHTLYWTLEDKKILPKADAIPMSVDQHIISGTTKPLDPTKYPVLLDAMSEIQSVQLPETPYTVWFVPLFDNRIAWDITKEATKTAIRQGEASKVYHWRSEDIEQVLEAIKDFECPYGGRLGDLIETTPRESMYLHMTEERCCETWYGGRTVLVGDDDMIMRRLILILSTFNMQLATKVSSNLVFKEYRERRFTSAKAAVDQCTLLRQGRAASLKRNVVFNYMPDKVRRLLDDKRHEDRPQLWFLPQVKDYGIISPLSSLSMAAKTISNDTTNAACESSAKVSLDAAANMDTNEIKSSVISTTTVSSTSSPRNSRTSWSSFSRPAFSMPSAPNVPLFASSTTTATKRTISDHSLVSSPRASTIQTKNSHDMSRGDGITDSITSTATADPVDSNVVEVVSVEDVDSSSDLTKSTQPPSQEDSYIDSSDEGEFVNCSTILDDDKESVFGKAAALTNAQT